jgi:hypothetical protein
MKSSRLNPVSAKKLRAAEAKGQKIYSTLARKSPSRRRSGGKKRDGGERYRDAHGIAFDEVRLWLPDSVKDWPKVKTVKNAKVIDVARELFLEHCFGDCWLCGAYRMLEFHHAIGGARRSDELTCAVMLCHDCHAEVQSQRNRLQDIFHTKWVHDREHTSWVRLILLLGRWPEFDSLDAL